MSSGYYEAHRPTEKEILEQRVKELEEEVARLKPKEPELVPWDASMGEHYQISGHGSINRYGNPEPCKSAYPFCFKTKEDAEQMRDYLQVVYKLRMQTKGFVPDWGDMSQEKHTIYYNHVDGYQETSRTYGLNYGNICYRTSEDAQAAADSLTPEEIETFKRGWPVIEMVKKG